MNPNKIRLSRFLAAALVAGILGWVTGVANAGQIIQDFYVPLPEAQIYTVNNTIVSGTGSSIFSTISIKVVYDNTVIYYDQWEDGYEVSLGAPTQSTTQIWGDGNNAHGIPPGMTSNPNGLAAGTIITLTNVVATQPRNPAVIQYDGRDHIGATKPIVVTKAHWPSTTGTVIAGCVSVLSTAQWGTNYLCPVGQDMTNGLMQYVGVFVEAENANTSVTITNNGGAGTNVILGQGQTFLYNGGLKKGASITASSPVQADMVIGHLNATYAVDWFTLYPVTSFGTNYYTAVGTSANGYPAYVYLFNPNTNAVAVTCTTKSGSSVVTVPGTNGVTQFTMPVSSGASFVCPTNFYAICTVNALPSADTTYNWGFSLVPTAKLTTEVDVGWAPGSSDLSQNGSPIWVTPLASTTIYVVYGDGTPTLTDTSGNKYSTNFMVAAYASQRVFDPSKNQGGMKLYTLDGTLITAAYGESADASQAGNPFIDAGYTVLPFPVPTLTKTVQDLTHPAPAAPQAGDTNLYTITIANNNLVPLENIVLIDTNSANQRYLVQTTTNYVGTQSTNHILDGTSPVFPLGSPGYTNAVIAASSSVTFTYRFTNNSVTTVITNQATIPSASSGLSSTLTAVTVVPIVAYPTPVINFTSGGTGNGVDTNLYYVNTNVFVTVTNAAISNSVTSITVTVTDTNTGDYESITLVEQGNGTGIYTNGLPSSATSGSLADDGILNAQIADGLLVTYPYSGVNYTSTAVIIGPTLTKQLYLNQTTNGATITTNGLNRLSPTYYGFTPTLQSSGVTAVWYNNAWLYRKTVTINYTNVSGSDLTNFPVLINSTDADLAARAQASGDDILFTSSDGLTKLPYERETYSSGALVAWINVPIVSQTANTILYMYYGNSAAADQQQSASAWNSGYKSVWHFAETTGTTLHDSTATGNTATNQGTATLGASGQIGSAVALNGTSQYLSTTTSYLDPSNYTVSIWLLNTPANAPLGHKIFGLENDQTSTGSANYDRMFFVNSSGKLEGAMYDNTAATRIGIISSASVTNGAWHYAVLTYYGTNLQCYLDGNSIGTARVGSAQAYTSGWWRMGSYALVNWTGGSNGYFMGSIDEARYSTSISSPVWVAAEYTNAVSPAKFYSLGTQMTGGNGIATFTQTPAFLSPFTLPSGGTISITNFITLTNGSFAATPNVTATLQTNGVDMLTLTSPTFNSGTGINTNLVWSSALAANYTIPSGVAITLVISNNVSGTAFFVNYGSAIDPSVILMPAAHTNVISIQSLSVNTAPYPAGVAVSSPAAGNTVYIDVTVSDPFGYYDMTSVGLAVTGPSTPDNFNYTLTNNAAVVATNGSSITFEYKWVTGPDVGNYYIAATAHEGTEGITDTASTEITTLYQDVGTPNVTTFTYGDQGPATNAYYTNNQVCVLVQDFAADTNPATAINVPIVISSSTGASIPLVLTETALNSGYFAGCFFVTNSSTPLGGMLYAPLGAVLTANYTNVNDLPVNSSAVAIVKGATGTNALATYKTVASPADGFAIIGQTVTYNLQVVNIGNGILNTVETTDSFPATLSYVTSSSLVGLTNASSLVWTNLGSLLPGQSTNFTVTFKALSAGAVTNLAWSASGLVLSYTNQAVETNIGSSITVAKTLIVPVSTNTVEGVGSTVVFQIAVTNTGTTTITNLPLEDYYDSTVLQYTNATVPANSAGGGTLIWTNLAPSGGLLATKGFTILVTNTVVGQARPTYNQAMVDYAVDQFGNLVPPASSTTNVFTAAAGVSGYVLFDETSGHTGAYSSSDEPLSGVTVDLYTTNGGVQTLVGATTTDPNGFYQFQNLPTNDYTVVETLLTGNAPSSPVIQVTNAFLLQNYTNVDFFQYTPAASTYATITGSVTNDLLGIGVAHTGDPGVSNVTVYLVQNIPGQAVANDPVIASTLTDVNGNYSFGALTPTNYIIVESPPYGYGGTGVTPANTLPLTTNNYVDIALTLTSGQNSTGNNFLIGSWVTIGDYTWLDINKDGLQAGTEPGLPGVTVTLYLTNATTHSYSTVATTVSTTNGYYAFTNEPPGTYEVGFTAPAGGYTLSPQLVGSNTNMNSAPSATTGLTAFFLMAELQTNLSLNAGFEPSPAAVSTVLLSAALAQGEVWVTWETFAENSLLGFDLTRTAAGGAAVDVTPGFVLARGLNFGSTYTVPDASAPVPGSYTYTLYGYYADGTVEVLASQTVGLTAVTVAPAGFVITSVTISGTNAIITWSGGQAPYTVEQSGTLGAGAAWSPAGPAQSGTQLTVPLTNQAGFFRVSSGGN